MTVALQLLTASDFQSQAGEDFIIHFSDEVNTPAQLLKVLPLPASPTQERKPFSILLQTNQKNHHYQQGIYSVESAALGSMHIFLVPVGYSDKGMQYEAVFA